VRATHVIVVIIAAVSDGTALAQPAFLDMEPGPGGRQLRMAEMRFYEASHDAKGPADSRDLFRRAGGHYFRVINEEEGHHHPDLFVNCGNSFLLADELPKAILLYRRGLQRYPLDGRLWENLEFARDQVAYPGASTRERPPGDDWPPFLPRATPNAVLFIALGLHALAWVAATAWLMTRHRKVAITTLALFAPTLLMLTWWGFLQYRIAEDARQPLVVVAVNGVTLRRGNGSLYPRHPDLPHVNRGMEARLVNRRGEWVLVQFPGGEIGWLPREVVLIDEFFENWIITIDGREPRAP
jgi:hypothetical protein